MNATANKPQSDPSVTRPPPHTNTNLHLRVRIQSAACPTTCAFLKLLLTLTKSSIIKASYTVLQPPPSPGREFEPRYVDVQCQVENGRATLGLQVWGDPYLLYII